MNYTSDDVEVGKENATYQFIHFGKVAFILLAIFGNTLVVVAVKRMSSLKTNSNVLQASLAVADVFVGLLVMPVAVYIDVTNGVFNLPLWGCNLWISADVLACTASLLNLTSISIDRFLAVLYPILYSTRCKGSRVYLGTLLALPWLISAAIAAPILFGANKSDNSRPDVCQFFNPYYSVISSLLSFLIPIITMIILYAKLIEFMCKRGSAKREKQMKTDASVKRVGGIGEEKRKRNESSSLLSEGTGETAQQSAQVAQEVPKRKKTFFGAVHGSFKDSFSKKTPDSKERKATITIIVVVAAFLICWVPFTFTHNIYVICNYLKSRDGVGCALSKHLPQILSFTVWLGYSNSSINPLIYAVFNEEYRLAFRILLGCGPKKSPNSSLKRDET